MLTYVEDFVKSLKYVKSYFKTIMFDRYRNSQYKIYQQSLEIFYTHPEYLIDIEKFIMDEIKHFINLYLPDIKRDYNEASYLYYFWKNYVPLDRGRYPKGDQYPWIEVGEQVFGNKLLRHFHNNFNIKDTGLPSGSDDRCIISSERIKDILKITDSAWVFIDIKSSGPRDDYDHAVMSPYQVSGSGNWDNINYGIINSPIHASGKYKTHDFMCALAPLYVLSDTTIAPLTTFVVKPIYEMILTDNKNAGQPLKRIKVSCIPNGILLSRNPNYITLYPGLFYPGKDDRKKDKRKIRARISFDILKEIDEWRVFELTL